jgi:hypothetical protein
MGGLKMEFFIEFLRVQEGFKEFFKVLWVFFLDF